MHVPVMLDEVMAGLAVQPGGNYIDATAGGGGHAEAIARGAQPGGRLVCLDRDAEAVEQYRIILKMQDVDPYWIKRATRYLDSQ